MTTGRTMNIFTEQAADIVQIWSLSDLNLLKILRAPRVAPVASSECVLGIGVICDTEQYPAEAQPFESRVMADGSVLMNTQCAVYSGSVILILKNSTLNSCRTIPNYPELSRTIWVRCACGNRPLLHSSSDCRRNSHYSGYE